MHQPNWKVKKMACQACSNNTAPTQQGKAGRRKERKRERQTDRRLKQNTKDLKQKQMRVRKVTGPPWGYKAVCPCVHVNHSCNTCRLCRTRIKHKQHHTCERERQRETERDRERQRVCVICVFVICETATLPPPRTHLSPPACERQPAVFILESARIHDSAASLWLDNHGVAKVVDVTTHCGCSPAPSKGCLVKEQLLTACNVMLCVCVCLCLCLCL